MAGKRSYAPKYGRRTRRRFTGRFSGYRSKVGYRKYIRKASGRTITSRPGRFQFSRRANRFNTAVAKSIRGMAESKVIAWRQIDYAQPVNTPTALGVSAVKFVAGDGALPSFGGYTPVGGFATSQGNTKADRDGQFVWLKGSTVNLTIQLDNQVPVADRAGPITFRVIVFKLKRALNPAGVSISPDNQLFLTNAGNNFGDSTAAPNNMGVMDMMLQPINTNSFSIICDRKFNLCHTQESASNAATNNFSVQTNMKSYKNMRLNLRANAKTRYQAGQSDPQDYDYRTGFAIYACYPNDAPQSSADIPATWSASIRGTTTFNDV